MPANIAQEMYNLQVAGPAEVEARRQQMRERRMLLPGELETRALANREKDMQLKLLQEFFGLPAPEAPEAGIQAPAISPPAQSPLVDLLRGRQGPELPSAAHPPMLAPEVAGIPPPAAAPGMGAGAMPAAAPNGRRRNIIDALVALHAPRSLLTGASGSGAETFGKESEYGFDDKGQLVPMQVGAGGTLKRLALPEGVQGVAPGVGRVDLGDKIGITDRLGNIVRVIPKDGAIPAGFMRGPDGSIIPRPGSAQEAEKNEAFRKHEALKMK